MDKYEQISVVGEGSYGVVMKCRHKDSGQLVAIKKFLETEDDATVRKMALREIRMLKKLRHENLVSMLEVFRRRKRFYLVFEYVERTVLEELEGAGGGLPDDVVRRHAFQLLRALDHCHTNNIIHRDVKPENVLVSRLGVVKLCDFGFARVAALPGEPYTEYVATRWYRAPELLVADPRYGAEVDIWAVGCLFAEMMTGDPLFPGESDIDQLYLIVKIIGKLSTRQQQLISRQPQLRGGGINSNGGSGNGNSGVSGPAVGGAVRALRRLLPSRRAPALALLAATLRAEPARRPPCKDLLRHTYFTHDGFADQFPTELRRRAQQEAQANPLLRKWQPPSGGRVQRDNADAVRQRGATDPVHHQITPQPGPPTLTIPVPPLPDVPLARAPGRSAKSAKRSSGEREANPPPSPVTPLSPPPQFLQHPATVQSRLQLQPSPPNRNNNITRSTIQHTFNQFPSSLHYQPRSHLTKRQEKGSGLFGEDMRPNRVWDGMRPLQPRHPRPSENFTLPTLPGANNSPLKSSKIKLQPLESSLNIPSYRQGSENSTGNRVTNNCLPYM